MYGHPHIQIWTVSLGSIILSRGGDPESNATGIQVPTNLTTWEWAFESDSFSQTKIAASQGTGVGAYENAITKARLDFVVVRDKAAWLSTTLVDQYGLEAGNTVSIFSTNSIWYPVAMWATVRVGT